MPVLLSPPAPEALSASWLGDEGTPEERAFAVLLAADGDLATFGREPVPAIEEDLAALPARVLAGMLRDLDALDAATAARRHEVLVAVAGPVSSGVSLEEVHVEHEVSVARRCSRYAAGKAIETARTIAAAFPAFAAALAAGQISAAHCSVLVERTRLVVDEEALAHIGRRALPQAKRLTPGEFGREVAKLVAGFDPDAAARATRAREDRRVWTRALEDGQSFLGLVHDTLVVNAIKDAITADALALRHAARADQEPAAETDDGSSATRVAAEVTSHHSLGSGATTLTSARGSRAGSVPGGVDPVVPDADWDVASLDALRADALATRMLGRIGPDGSIGWDRSEARVIVNVVMDLDTLRAEAEAPGLALVDDEPVPAPLARDLADAATWWRRLVTDPVDGHLLDYGTITYLPPRLRTYVLARDGGCRAPGCTNRAPRRLQMDHALEWNPSDPDGGGESSATNCGTLCTTCHQLKTARHARITGSRADGSATWTTAWGQRVTIPPRPVLLDLDPEPPPW